MSSNIFPVKLHAIYFALNATGVLASLVEETKQYGLSHDDDKVRITLRSPEVMRLVCKVHERDDCRVRLAFPANEPTFSQLCDETMFELYSVDKEVLREPTCITSVSAELSNAIQVELFQLLLRAKGIDIPLL